MATSVRAAALDATSLRPDERELLERFVPALERELGEELRAVWLYGSAARGEVRHEESDVDLLVIVDDTERAEPIVEDLREAAGGENGWPSFLSVHVDDPAWVADRRSIEAFFIAEVDRDKVVLAGERLDDLPFEPVPEGPGMRTRSRELLHRAREKLQVAELAASHDLWGPALSLAYESMLEAAAAALSEEDLYAKTHSGIWNLFLERLVASGRFPREFHTVGARNQDKRAKEVYKGWAPPDQESREVIDYARRLIDAVVAEYGE